MSKTVRRPPGFFRKKSPCTTSNEEWYNKLELQYKRGLIIFELSYASRYGGYYNGMCYAQGKRQAKRYVKRYTAKFRRRLARKRMKDVWKEY